MNHLFVYGIFLSEGARQAYGMSNPRYATVKNYVTYGNQIVTAYRVPEDAGVALTGLVVDVDPRYWPDIDDLEANYNRSVVTTTDQQQVYMYTGKETDNG